MRIRIFQRLSALVIQCQKMPMSLSQNIVRGSGFSRVRCLPAAAILAVLLVSPVRAQVADIDSHWRWHPGDDAAWAAPDYDDSSWESVPFNTVPAGKWNNIGWFRFTLRIDSAMYGGIAGLSLSLRGAAEVYFEGRLFPHNYGIVGRDAGEEEGFFLNWEPLPQPVPVAGPRPGDSLRRVIHVAIRYSSFLLDLPFRTGLDPEPLLRFESGSYDQMLSYHARRHAKAVSHQMLLLGAFAAFAIVHLLMFVFYPRMKENLYFSALMLLLAVIAWLRFDLLFQSTPGGFAWGLISYDILGNFALLIALRIIYYIAYPTPPRRYRIYVILTVLLSVAAFQTVTTPVVTMFACEIILMLEMLATLVSLWVKKQRPHIEGSGIIAVGFLPFIVSALWMTFVTMKFVTPHFDFVDFPQTYYAALILVISVSVFLSRRFAHTNHELEKQLVEVRRLAEENLRQERERMRLEGENERKRKELEDARDLQRSMLPDKVPDFPGYDIAVYLQPATEVGGDYYDFHCQGPDSLTIACGDATGHGMQAGIMVAASKGLFRTLACGEDLSEMLRRMSLTLKDMGFERIFMAMAFARLKGNNLSAVSAGMPFPLVFRAVDGSVEELQLRGMPLGSFPDFPYREMSIDLDPGDVVLFMSDGLPEMFNPRDELYGDERTKETFALHARGSSVRLVRALVEAGAAWAEGRPQEDDVTFLVLKRNS